MIKEKFGMLIAGVVVLAGIGYGVWDYINLTKENDDLILKLNEAETKIVSVENNKKELEKENLDIKNKNEVLRVELSDVKEQYEELNRKYQKEISPVNFKD